MDEDLGNYVAFIAAVLNDVETENGIVEELDCDIGSLEDAHFQMIKKLEFVCQMNDGMREQVIL